MPFASQTSNFVVQRTFRFPPCHSTAFDLIPLISESSFRRSAKDAASFSPCIESQTTDSDGMIIRNESSVSMWADRELRFVDPKRVRTGGDEELGDSHTPIENRSQVHLIETLWNVGTFRVVGPPWFFPLAQQNPLPSPIFWRHFPQPASFDDSSQESVFIQSIAFRNSSRNATWTIEAVSLTKSRP